MLALLRSPVVGGFTDTVEENGKLVLFMSVTTKWWADQFWDTAEHRLWVADLIRFGANARLVINGKKVGGS